MRTILLTALCAITIGTQAKVANDTIDKYIIDKQPVEHFDGSQLEGKCISKYMIAYKQGRGVVERHHVIYTGDESEKTIRISNGPIVSMATDPLLIVDGKETSPEDFAKLNLQAIDHIDVLKNGSKAAEQWGSKGLNGVIIVTTKAYESTEESKFNISKYLIIVDGKETPLEEFNKIKPESTAEYVERFASMEIFKPGSKEAKSYGEKGRNGVIIVKTKGAKK